MPIAISVTEAWKEAHPDALIGVLEVSGVDNTRPSPMLEQRKRAAESDIRARYRGFSRADFSEAHVLAQ